MMFLKLTNLLLANAAVYGPWGFAITGILLIPIILIEGYILKRWLQLPYGKGVLAATIANLVSTFPGGFLGMAGLSRIADIFNSPVLAICLFFVLTLLIEFPAYILMFRRCEVFSILKATLIGNMITYLLLAGWMIH